MHSLQIDVHHMSMCVQRLNATRPCCVLGMSISLDDSQTKVPLYEHINMPKQLDAMHRNHAGSCVSKDTRAFVTAELGVCHNGRL